MISVNIEDAEELPALLPYTGMFDLTDCYVRVKHFPETPVQQLEKIEQLLNYTINVIDIEYQTIEYGDRIIIDIDDAPIPLTSASN